MILKKILRGRIFAKVESRTFVFTHFPWRFLSTLTKYQSNKIGGHWTCFLVKYFEISLMSSRVFVLVKSESYKNMGYSCAVLATADCCVYTCRHPSSLFQEEKNHTHPICALLFVFFPIKCNVW